MLAGNKSFVTIGTDAPQKTASTREEWGGGGEGQTGSHGAAHIAAVPFTLLHVHYHCPVL